MRRQRSDRRSPSDFARDLEEVVRLCPECAADAPHGELPECDSTNGEASEAKTGFYAAAMRFEISRPWDKATESHALAIDLPALGWKGACLTLRGDMGEPPGFALSPSLAAFEALVRLRDNVPGLHPPEPGSELPLFTFSLLRMREMAHGKQMAADARAQGFLPGPSRRLLACRGPGDRKSRSRAC